MVPLVLPERDLANLCNEAALLAARGDAQQVTMRHFEEAKDKVMMGAERRSMIISDKEKKTTAVHEAGHALVAVMLPGTDPIHKVTIIPRGMALGITQQLPVDEKHTHAKDYLVNQLTILMGGRAAEKLVLDQFTTGASNDIERATSLSRKMVCEWGMNEKLGPVAFGQKEEQIFLGREISQHRDFSENTAKEIDEEVHMLVRDSYATAFNILVENRELLDKLTEVLLDVEVIEGVEIEKLIESVKQGKEYDANGSKGETNETDKETKPEEEPAAPAKSAKKEKPGGLTGIGGTESPALF